MYHDKWTLSRFRCTWLQRSPENSSFLYAKQQARMPETGFSSHFSAKKEQPTLLSWDLAALPMFYQRPAKHTRHSIQPFFHSARCYANLSRLYPYDSTISEAYLPPRKCGIMTKLAPAL